MVDQVPSGGTSGEPSGDPPGDLSKSTLLAWRRQMLDVVLAVAAALNVVPVVLLWTGPPSQRTWAVPLTVILVLMIAVAFARHLDLRVRGGILILLAYAAALAGLLDPTQPYNGWIILLGMPVLAGAVLGRAGAWLCGALSLAVVGGFAALAWAGRADLSVSWSEARGEWRFWFGQGGSLLVWLAVLGYVLDRFIRHQRTLLRAEQEARGRAEQEARERSRLEGELLAVGDRERQRLGREIHDGVCQQLATALLSCRAAESGVPAPDEACRRRLQASVELVEGALDQAQVLARGLDPPGLAPGALVPALRDLVRRVQTAEGEARTVRYTGATELVLDALQATHLYHVAREAVTNALRHSDAREIIVALEAAPDAIVLRVTDDGRGIPEPGVRKPGMGLSILGHRAARLGGRATVERRPEGGTVVECRVPRTAAEAGKANDRAG